MDRARVPQLAIDTSATKTRALRRSQTLFRQGDQAAAIFFVESGRLRLERRTSDGRLVVIHTARPGEFFAEASLFSDVYHCDAVATEACRVRSYPKQAVLAALRTDPAQALSFLAVVARQLQDLRQRLELRNVRSARERVLLFLGLHADAKGQATLPGQLQDVAADIGLSREALYRTLAALEEDGAIARTRAGIVIKKPLGA
jgi:CRP-like cAMP-binding protein